MFKSRTNQWSYVLLTISTTLLLSSCASRPVRMAHTESSRESSRAIAEVIALNKRMVESLSQGDLSILEQVIGQLEKRISNGRSDQRRPR